MHSDHISEFLKRPWWVRLKMRWCKHCYTINEDNSAIRTCTKCGRVEWLFTQMFPQDGEDPNVWEEMF